MNLFKIKRSSTGPYLSIDECKGSLSIVTSPGFQMGPHSHILNLTTDEIKGIIEVLQIWVEDQEELSGNCLANHLIEKEFKYDPNGARCIGPRKIYIEHWPNGISDENNHCWSLHWGRRTTVGYRFETPCIGTFETRNLAREAKKKMESTKNVRTF